MSDDTRKCDASLLVRDAAEEEDEEEEKERTTEAVYLPEQAVRAEEYKSKDQWRRGLQRWRLVSSSADRQTDRSPVFSRSITGSDAATGRTLCERIRKDATADDGSRERAGSDSKPDASRTVTPCTSCRRSHRGARDEIEMRRSRGYTGTARVYSTAARVPSVYHCVYNWCTTASRTDVPPKSPSVDICM